MPVWEAGAADFGSTVEAFGKGVDAAGVAVIVLCAIGATALFLARRPGGDGLAAYRLYRQRLGRVILLGLEFLVAGDIIRSVAVEPTFRSVGILAVIVLIRSFLSTELEMEIEGRWPWQHRRDEQVASLGDAGPGPLGRAGQRGNAPPRGVRTLSAQARIDARAKNDTAASRHRSVSAWPRKEGRGSEAIARSARRKVLSGSSR